MQSIFSVNTNFSQKLLYSLSQNSNKNRKINDNRTMRANNTA